MQPDHLFIVARGDRATPTLDGDAARASATQAMRWADALIRAGFTEGPPRRHPGQGTANHSFFLEHIMLELLYIDDADALAAADPEPLRLHRRFTDPSASPFGIAFRPDDGIDREAAVPGFDSVSYRPGYLPDGLHIDVARHPGSSDPLLFHLGFAGAFWDTYDADAAGNPRLRLRRGRLEQPLMADDAVRAVLEPADIEIHGGPGVAHRLRLELVAVNGASPQVATGPVALPDDLPLAIVVSSPD